MQRSESNLHGLFPCRSTLIKSMRRFTVHTNHCIRPLFAGVVIAVAVSWVSALTVAPLQAGRLQRGMCSAPAQSSSMTWQYVYRWNRRFPGSSAVLSSIGYANASSVDPGAALPKWSRVHDGPTVDELQRPDAYFEVFEVAHGWPFLSLMSRSRADMNHWGSPGRWQVEGGIRLLMLRPHQGDMPRVLPLVPVWPGAVLNVAIYATVWRLGVHPIWRLIQNRCRARRAASRLRRDLCPHCAYPIDKSRPAGTVCPECGKAPTPARKKAASP